MDQHKKTLGQIAFEQACGGTDNWDNLEGTEQSDWEAVANVISTEVLYRIEEGLKLL